MDQATTYALLAADAYWDIRELDQNWSPMPAGWHELTDPQFNVSHSTPPVTDQTTADTGGNDYLSAAPDVSTSLLAQAGNDALNGSSADDLLEGGMGDDVLAGGPGRDTPNGGDGNDSLVGDGKDDDLYAGAGNDTLLGDDSALVLAGEAHGADYLDGEDGDDTLYGTEGADTLFGGAQHRTEQTSRRKKGQRGPQAPSVRAVNHGRFRRAA